jgi:hypothetical protein
MKARPRGVEREVASCLSNLLSDIGSPTIERIPVLGRTGPDLTYHPRLNLIIDVKSRKAVPISMLAHARCPFRAGDLIGVRLEDLLWYPGALQGAPRPLSKVVLDWWNHMDEWTRQYVPEGISALVLHRPRMPIGHSTVIFSVKDRKELCHRLTTH